MQEIKICECKEETKERDLIRTKNYLLHYNKDYLFILHSNYTKKSYIENKAVNNAEGYKEIVTQNGYTLFVSKDLNSYVIHTPKNRYYLVD